MSRKGLTIKEVARRERIARKQHDRDAKELRKHVKLAITAALSPFKPPNPVYMQMYRLPWHGMTKPRVKAIAALVKRTGYYLHQYQAKPPIQITDKNLPTLYFDDMQSVASWALARYELEKDKTDDGPQAERV